MKAFKSLAFICTVTLMASCGTTVKFPISSTVPAADISANKKQDKNKNYVITVSAKNLAKASRLNPSKKNYSVWIVDENWETKNIGKLSNRNAKKTHFKTITPFNVKKIFITAEDQGDLNYPAGIEISRAAFNK